MTKRKGLTAAFWMGLSGIALGLSAPGFDLWMLAWVALIPALVWSDRQDRWQDAFIGGALFGAVFHGLYFIWFWDLHPLTWLGFSEWGSWLVTGAGWLLLVSEGALLAGILMVAFQKLADKPGWMSLLLFPLLWVGVFSLQSLTPMALPWAFLEYTQASLPVMRWLAGYVGGAGITVLIVFYNTFWARQWLKPTCMPCLARMLLAPALLLLAGPWTPSEAGPPLPVPTAVIQGNIPIEIIRSANLTDAEIKRAYLNPLRKAPLPPGTLVVMPEEGVVPGWVETQVPLTNPHAATLQAISREKQIAIAVGASTLERKIGKLHRHNSILLVTPEGFQFYHKRRLVPFGEYTPYLPETWLTGSLALFGIDYANVYQPGKQAPVISLPNQSVKLGGLVCFELIDRDFSGHYKASGANLLINTSNLGWFHGNPWLESQFLAIGQLRAAENRIPLAIASNTGISALISPQGRILKRTEIKKTNSPHKPDLIFYNGGR